MGFQGFPPDTLRFLKQLKKNNNREWFQARRNLFEEQVKAPLTELVLQVGEALRSFAPEMAADPKSSIYRIYRDTRFSRDKRPYKTQIAAVFPIRGMPKHAGPGLYFHVSPDEVLMGGGIYMPDSGVLRAIRENITENGEKFLSIVEGKAFRKTFGDLEGEQLKSMPKGFRADSVAAKYLRYKQILFGEMFEAGLAETPQLFSAIVACFKKGMPLIRFLHQPAARALNASSRLGAERATDF